ncbi:hypothetical protein RS130_04475 [Paraglaciecola aquimarina]|uniref:Uncharacterized protein n=1 Tax=Paraglaciecola aquimarina TaxID=1235557 RepID=A0ABU3STE7_9ALTE|nr:hypothetical protein [Paraglaciecola aquimarina]MDU0353284.1 hypothetical protein [Paraglaciecola aquimarina]
MLIYPTNISVADNNRRSNNRKCKIFASILSIKKSLFLYLLLTFFFLYSASVFAKNHIPTSSQLEQNPLQLQFTSRDVDTLANTTSKQASDLETVQEIHTTVDQHVKPHTQNKSLRSQLQAQAKHDDVHAVYYSPIDKQAQLSEFEQLEQAKNWQLKFSDPATTNWQDNWFLDGEVAQVVHSKYGMELIAGPVNLNDAHHAVLWTKQSFLGDLKIQYHYTRTDNEIVNVNILLIQATGIGNKQFAKDITQWNDYRQIPTMSKYWLNMHAIHISFAAFPMVNENPNNDYIRVRRYPAANPQEFNDTEVKPAFSQTGLFKTGMTYKMTWMKTNSRLFLQVEGDDLTKQYSWDLSRFEPITNGRIGLRHMFTRSAAYKNFKVWQLKQLSK